MNAELDFDSALEYLFSASNNALRARLVPLSPEQRNDLFKACKTILSSLRKICAASPKDWNKTITLKQLYRHVLENPADFLQRWPQIEKKHGGLMPFDTSTVHFFIKLQMLQVGLAPVKQVITGLKPGRYSNNLQWQSDYALHIGRVLLDRPESWAVDSMVELFTQIDTWLGEMETGLAALYQELITQRPEWQDAVQPYLGKIMALDGFWDKRAQALLNDGDLVLAGLNHELSRDNWRLPILDDKVKALLKKHLDTGQINRSALLTLILEKLQSPRRPMEIKGWRELFEQLNPSVEELEREAVLDLINVSTSPVAQLGIKLAAERWQQQPKLARELAEPLAYALLHDTQAVASKAFALLGKITKAEPELQTEALASAVQALATPHDKLRHQLCRWLGGFAAKQLPAHVLDELMQIVPSLKTNEREALAALLPDDHVPDDSVRPGVDPKAALLSWLRQSEPPSSQPQHDWWNYLQAFMHNRALPELQAIRPDPCVMPEDSKPFTLYSTVTELIGALQQLRHKGLSNVTDPERVLASVLQFREEIQQPAIREAVAELAKPLKENEYYNIGIGIAQWIAQCCLDDSPADILRSAPMLGWLSPLQMLVLRLEKLPELWQLDQRDLLAAPTTKDGWLHPVIFAERYLVFPRQALDSEELRAALLRLPQNKTERQQAWQCLSKKLDLSLPFGQAIALALGPDEIAAKAADLIINNLRPSLSLYRRYEWGLNTSKDRSYRAAIQAKENRSYRLFHAALRARFGLADPRPWLEASLEQAIPRSPRSSLIERTRDSMKSLQDQFINWLPDAVKDMFDEAFFNTEPSAENYEQLDTLLDQLLLYPEPINTALRQRCSTKRMLSASVDTLHPYIEPYLCIFVPHYHIPDGFLAELAHITPPLAQRLFEAGVELLVKREAYAPLPMDLIGVGALPQVTVADRLETILGLLVEKKPANREQAIDLLLIWLQDGRIAPQALAAGLTSLCSNTKQGFRYLDQALASLCASGAAGQGIVQEAIEQLLANNLKTLSPANLSLVLSRLQELLEDSGTVLYNASARSALENLTASRKKSVAADKARFLLARSTTGTPYTLPPLIACVTSLATMSSTSCE